MRSVEEVMIGLENKALTSKRLTYRLLCEGDKEALSEILSDRSVTEPAGFTPVWTKEEFDTFFAELTAYNTGIAILKNETLIGYIHVHKYIPDTPEYIGKKCVSTGFVIGKEYQNNGYGTETLETLTAYLKRNFDYCFVSHFTDNIPSKRVIEKCAYRYFEEYTMFFEDLGKDMTLVGYVI